MARIPIDEGPGSLTRFVDWAPGMDQWYWHIPSQPCDPLRAMEESCRWQCTQPRQNLRLSFDKTKYYKPNRNYQDTARARGIDASGHRDRSLARFCDVLWCKPQPPAGAIQLTSRDVHRLLEQVGLEAAYRQGGLAAIAKAVGLTKRQREAFVLWPHFRQEEIAARLGITQEAVSQRLANVVEQCRRWAGRTQNLISAPLSLDSARARRQSLLKRSRTFPSVANF